LRSREGGRAQRRPGESNIFAYLFMPSIIDLCRELRKKQAPAEEGLWQHLRNRNFLDKKFLRQHPICVQSVLGKNLYYIPDFYCDEAKLVIEADGPVHLFKKEYDRNRDEVLAGFGLTILRFTNDNILTDLEGVLNRIKKELV
jgi:very-short-patch-repair endonuclease